MQAHTSSISRRCLRNQHNAVNNTLSHPSRRIVRVFASAAEDEPVSNPTSPDSESTAGPAHHVQDAQRTYRQRQPGHRALPLPPIMDPIAFIARERWRFPKADPDHKNLTPFQERLYKNAFAVALATPKRMCAMTWARLPYHFLLELRPSLHPDTKDPWLLPTSYNAKATATSDISNDFPPARCLMRHDFVHWARLGKRWHDAVPTRLATRLDNVLGNGAVKKMIWREDMASLVGERLGAVVLRKLRWFLGRNGSRKFAVPGIEDAEEVDGVVAVLFLRPLMSKEVREAEEGVREMGRQIDNLVRLVDTLVDDLMKEIKVSSNAHFFKSLKPVTPRLQPSLQFPPLKWQTMRWRGKEMPVYDLVELLGEERCKELVKDTWFEKVTSVILREDRRTVSPHLALMQLQDYYIKPMP